MNAKLETSNSKLTNGQLIRGLGLVAAISVNVANVIGTGVFLKARVMTCNVGTPGKALTVWLVAGLLSLAGALTYAELLAMFPRAAGEYGIMRDAYGRPWGFFYGWTQFAIARSASAAALAVGFAIFFNELLKGALNKTFFTVPYINVPFGRLQLVALAAISLTVIINCAAVTFSGGVATFLTAIKVLVLIAVGVGAFLYSGGDWSHLSQANVGGACEGVAITAGGLGGFAAAMLGALWAYDGWNNITFLAGEVKNPQRNLPLALIISMFLVMGLYLLVNIGYYHVLSPTDVASVSAKLSVAAEVVRRLLGSIALTLMAAAMMTSSFGALHASILATSRVPYAMARDGLFFRGLAKLSPRTHVPIRSLVVLGIWSTVLALSGSYDQLSDAAVFSLTLFYTFVAGSVFIFRRRLPNADRPYRTFGYPVVPIIYLVVTGSLLARIVWDARSAMSSTIALILHGQILAALRESLQAPPLASLLFIALGLPVFLYLARQSRRVINEE
jgi:APA family basic amino acid/polyamine antiporter